MTLLASIGIVLLFLFILARLFIKDSERTFDEAVRSLCVVSLTKELDKDLESHRLSKETSLKLMRIVDTARPTPQGARLWSLLYAIHSWHELCSQDILNGNKPRPLPPSLRGRMVAYLNWP